MSNRLLSAGILASLISKLAWAQDALGPEFAIPPGSVETASETGRYRVSELLDQPVNGTGGQEVGRIADVIVNDGAIESIVLVAGGFAGIGDRQVALPFTRFTIAEDGAVTAAGMTAAEVDRLPQWQWTEETLVDDAASTGIYDHSRLDVAPVEPLEIDPELAEIDPRLAEGIAANEAAFNEKSDHAPYDNEPAR
jgi:sporulation protein YlmC with PRC-barrel domain